MTHKLHKIFLDLQFLHYFFLNNDNNDIVNLNSFGTIRILRLWRTKILLDFEFYLIFFKVLRKCDLRRCILQRFVLHWSFARNFQITFFFLENIDLLFVETILLDTVLLVSMHDLIYSFKGFLASSFSDKMLGLFNFSLLPL